MTEDSCQAAPQRSIGSMNRAQRVVLILYCLMLAYCCLWIPWSVTYGFEERKTSKVVYSFLWAAPNLGRYWGTAAIPDMRLVALRILAITALAGAAIILAGTF